ncbi:MAG: aspartyl protease family protein [Acidobacteriaceae bacterium]
MRFLPNGAIVISTRGGEDVLRGMHLTVWASVFCLLAQRALVGAPSIESSAPAARPGISSHATGAITVPFEYFNQHIYVVLTVNDRPGLIFMLDSGASRNILNLRTARRLGIKSRNLKQERNVGFGAERIYVAPETPVRAEIESVPVARVMSVMDLGKFERHSSHAIDGMLGHPFLQQFVVKLDFENDLLTLFPAAQFSYHGLGVRVGLRDGENFAAIPITVGSSKYVHHTVDAVIDTGSNMALLLYERSVRPLDLEESLSHATPIKAFGLNGYFDVDLGSVHSLQIGIAVARGVPVDYIDRDEEVHLVRNIAGEIGNGILHGFTAVIFDVPHRRMFFELKRPPPLQSGTVRTVEIVP